MCCGDNKELEPYKHKERRLNGSLFRWLWKPTWGKIPKYLGFAMIVKAGRVDLVTADTAQDELTQLG